jgi:hypothetical protein
LFKFNGWRKLACKGKIANFASLTRVTFLHKTPFSKRKAAPHTPAALPFQTQRIPVKLTWPLPESIEAIPE